MAKFSEIRAQIPQSEEDWEWITAIPDDSPVELVDFDWGADVPEIYGVPYAGCDVQIGIVIQGCIEILEIHQFADYTAFRPIRIINEGGIFNDFDLLDKAILGRGAISRSDEEWFIRAGKQSSISILEAEDISTFSVEKDSTTLYGTDIFLKNKHSGTKIKIAYVSLCSNSVESDIIQKLLRISWKRVNTYRIAPNSYNFQNKIHYFRRVIPAFEGMVQKTAPSKNKYGNATMHRRIELIFIDAVFDAINRPLRNEPLFFCEHEEDCVLKSDYVSLKGETRLFYFPIDLNNHLVAQYFNLMCAQEKIGKITYKSMERTEKITKAFGVRDMPSPPGDGNKGNNSEFWLSTADAMISRYLTNYPGGDYPYSVKAVTKQDFRSRPILLLEFSPKNDR